MATTLIVSNGTIFDGSGDAGRVGDVVVRDGIVVAITEPGASGVDASAADIEVIDATGMWVTPGFVDIHTHYDAELEISPGLVESVRHGVTSVLVGSCGLSMVVGEVEDLADMFCRVEGLPRPDVLRIFGEVKTWETPGEYAAHLRGLDLGPNVMAMVGHSTIRAHAMGLGKALDGTTKPSATELATMSATLNDALDHGFLGLSVNTLPWDKMDGDRYRSSPTPSVFAPWSELRALAKVLRDRGAVYQALPDISTKWNMVAFLAQSAGFGRRPALRSMFLTLLDAKADRIAWRAAGALANLTNGPLKGNARFQSLPNPFDLWVDGLEVPVLEEIGAGTEALHIEDADERKALMRDPAYRARFRKDWGGFSPNRAYHRDLDETEILEAPDATLVGKSFGDVARERGIDPIDAFLDLQAEHGNDLRWYTVVGNDRPDVLEQIIAHPAVLIGFSDAGAHLRNMAYYNFPLRMLKRVTDTGFMSVGHAVHRLTREIADFLELPIGRIERGWQADLVVIDPTKLDDSVEQIHTAPMDAFPGLERLVRRNDATVPCVIVNGRVVWRDGEPAPSLGKEPFGRFLAAAGAPA